ncbi:MAG: hypothetical protein ACREIP_21295 [Alphaproteobacteria bacterium]
MAAEQIAPPARPAYLEQSNIGRRYSFSGTVLETARYCFHRLEFLWLDLRAGRLGRSGRRSFSAGLWQLWSDWAYYRRFIRRCERDPNRIFAHPFVFFPFQNEPEFSVQARCKEFNDQSAIARQIAMSLPAGLNLVIKEHAWIGGRQLSFYENLLSLPNVIMAHPGLRAIDLIPRAAAVASLGGTVTLEAGLFGKSAIIFSERSEFSFLPHVRIVDAMRSLPHVLREVVAPLQAEIALRYRKAAARLCNATETIGVEAEPLFRKDATSISDAQVERAALLLQNLLALHEQERARGRSRLDA